MTIKFDRIFEVIHDKCRILFNNLIPSIEERCMYSDLFFAEEHGKPGKRNELKQGG